MTLYKIKDDLEAGWKPNGPRPFLRVGLPSTVRINGGAEFVNLSPEWMNYVAAINDPAGRRYQFDDPATCLNFKEAVGWHNQGKNNRVEQLTFSGNIVDVVAIEGNKAYIRCFYNTDTPPAIRYKPTSSCLDPLVQLLTVQYSNKLDMTTNGKYPRTLIIANDRSERLWIDTANLKPYIGPIADVHAESVIALPKCPDCGTELTCQKCHPIIQVVTVEPEVPTAEQPITPPASDYELWVDIYQGDETPDFKVLKDNGVAGIIAKIGYGYNNNGSRGSVKDKKFLSYIEGALKQGLGTAGYWWNHPTEDWNRQVDTCLDAIRNVPLKFLSVDVEQNKGSVLQQNNKGKWVWGPGTFSSSQISGAGQFMAAALDDLYKVLVYTRTDFIYSSSPKMLDWMIRYGLWLAAYPDSHVYTCDKWVAEDKGFTYCPTWQDYMTKHAPKPDTALVLPKGITSWYMWQFTGDRVKLPGLGGYTDLNYLRVT